MEYEDYYRSQGLVPNADGTEWVAHNSSWVDQAPLPVQNPDATPADRAAFTVARAVKRSNPLPVADDRGHPFGPLNPEAPSYLMEPDLQEAQGGINLPTNMYSDDAGQVYFNDTNKPVPIVRRPGVLPVAMSPEGIKFAMPKALDLVSNVMGNVGGKVMAKPGEMVLGSGVVRTEDKVKDLMKKWDGEGVRNYVAEQSEAVGGHLKLHDLVVPKEKRGEGVGTKFMEDLVKLADEEGKTVVLTAAKDYGATSLNRLKDFYKRFGFVENKGRNKDFRISDNMYRKPDILLSDTRNQVAGQVGHQIEKGPFYSQLERTVENAKINLATPEQWLGYLKNQPGVKAEELNHVLGDLPKEGMLSKEQLADYVKQNKVELKETTLGDFETARKNLDKHSKIVEDIAGKLDDEIHKISGTTSFNFQGNKIYADELSHGLFSGDIKPSELPKELQSVGTELADAFKAREAARYEFQNSNKDKFKTQYHQYQLPGGEAYKETLLSLPGPKERLKWNELSKKQHEDIKELYENMKYDMGGDPEFIWKSPEDLYEKMLKNQNELYNNYAPKDVYNASHFGEHGTNLIAHTRTNERELPNIGRGTHVEEFQSDLHQGGREYGYKGEVEKLKPDFDKVEAKLMATNDDKLLGLPTVKQVLAKAIEDKIITKQEAATYKRYTDIENHTARAVPDFPFKKNWDEVLIKRLIHDAVDKGHKFITVTPGEAQALRYQNEIRQKVNTIDWHNFKSGKPSPNSEKQVLIDAHSGEMNLTVDKHGVIVSGHPELKGKTLDEAIGKDIAKQILEKDSGNIDAKGYVMGAEGMKGYYDKMVVDKFNGVGKKYGAKMEPFGKEYETHRGFPAKMQLMNSRDNSVIREFDSEHEALKWAKKHDYTKDVYLKPGKEIPAIKQPVHYFPITEALEKKAKEGFELFSTANPTLIPVDRPPEFDNKEKKPYRLVPISGNPFQ